MASDNRSWSLDSVKKKSKKILSSNGTIRSIPGRVVSSETKNKIRNLTDHAIEEAGARTIIDGAKDKARNLTDRIIEQTGAGSFVNKTKTWIDGKFSPEDESSIPKGFFDSLFYPQTTDDVYLKTAVICLWTIAMLSILVTMMTMIKGITRRERRTTGIRRFFIHIFFCEFCYLIYILLSMINVALNFKLNFFFCGIGKYGMYATIPIMYVVLVILAFERITNLCYKTANKLFGNILLVQPILFLVWVIGIGAIALFIFIKQKAKNLPSTLIGEKFLGRLGPFGTMLLPGRCSIDGQLLPAFKIILVILFIVLIVLIIESLANTVIYSFFTPSCCEGKKKSKKQNKDHATLIFILVLLLNLFFSFPFYLISTMNSVIDTFRGNKPFPMTLKVSFIFRLISIIFQCFVFMVLESNSWSLLNKFIQLLNCKKCAMLTRKTTRINKPSADRELQPLKKVKPVRSTTVPDTHQDDVRIKLPDPDDEVSDDDDDDDVFLDDSSSKPLTRKPPEMKKSSAMDSDDTDDDETGPVPTRISSTKEKKMIKKSSPTKVNIESETLRKPTSTNNHANGISKPITNGKVASQKPTTDKKTSKSNTNGNLTKRAPSLSDPPTEGMSDESVNSDDGIKPTIAPPKTKTITPSNSDKQNRPPVVSSQNPQRPRRRYIRVSRPIRSTVHHHSHPRTFANRRRSPRNVPTHSEEAKQDRQKKIYVQSTPV